MLSPIYSLDQTDTYKDWQITGFYRHLSQFWVFVRGKWNGKGVTGKNRESIWKRQGYNTISDFKSALVALDNFIADYPGTPYKEDALYYKFDSAYQLGINSVPAKWKSVWMWLKQPI
jgi:outer membrane protein assembly factor BamD